MPVLKYLIFNMFFVLTTKMFGFSNPKSVNLIKQNLLGERLKLIEIQSNGTYFHYLRGGIRNSYLKFKQEGKGRVAFVGGSITYNSGWRDSICNYLRNRFPETTFDFISAGISSMGSTPAAFRLDRDVFKYGPVDLIFEEAAVNDALNFRTDKEQLLAMEGIVRHVRRHNSKCDIVLLHFADTSKINTYNRGKEPGVIKNHESVAIHYNISSINIAKEVTQRINSGEFNWEDDFKDLHPSPFGQGIYFSSIKAFLEEAWSGQISNSGKLLDYNLPKALHGGNYQYGELIPIYKLNQQRGWYFMPNWNPKDGKATRANYTNVPMLVSESFGIEYKYKFKGDAVGIAIAAGPDAGIIEYCIDNGKWKKQDLFTKWSSGLHIPWYFTLGSELEFGKHSLKIRMLKEKNPQSKGNICRIRYFYVNNKGDKLK
ncbi:SGNH/GDSL hydrolase family protein [Aestuariibaculum sediminum]|uniref:SGNH/GDSL hydrolase family protein n=1 Tax=Aestuariibaculum sediminum TaxID=2770637 RepID=A0A8J6PZ56_9FLAO|nr:SGNH/GDSL hydrolase family protein [Aestuariibaculum sediminum]MBD0831623.1 SGNH/GDSL hydrolase family protein [Aestuariibaculum sediminum]